MFSSCDRYEFAYLYENLGFEMGRVYRPDIPSREVNIIDFGAVAVNPDRLVKMIEYENAPTNTDRKCHGSS